MTKFSRRNNKPSLWWVLLLTLGVGWLGYRIVEMETVSLKPAPPSKPTILSRAEWSARSLDLESPEEPGLFDVESNREGVLYYEDDLRSVLNTIVVHHTAIPNASAAEIQELHMDGRGFADAAYHFLIDSDGMIYEGREISIRGAHVQGFNTGSVGIALLGNFNETVPTQSQLDSLESLVDYLRFTYEIRFLAGHKDYPDQSPDGTECPGANLYPRLSEMAQKLGMIYGIDGYVVPTWVEPYGK